MNNDLAHLIYLLRNRESVTREEISIVLGVHKREVQNIIAGLQKEGWDIISDSRGYWIPQTIEDIPRIVKAAKTRHKHAISELLDASRFLNIARKIKYRKQQELF